MKGFVFGWSAPTYVPSSRFIRAAELAGGFDRSYVSNYHAKAFLTNLKLYMQDNQLQEAGSDLFLRKLRREGGVFRYAVVRESRYTEPVDESVVVVFALGGDGAVEYVKGSFPVSKEELQRLLDHSTQEVCTASVLAVMARRIVDMGAVPLRKGGGAYFAPAALPRVLEYVESVVGSLDGTLVKFGVTGMEFELAAIFDAFSEYFHLATGELRKRLLLAKQQKTLDRVAAEFHKLMEIAEVYRDLLEGYRYQLDVIVDHARQGVIGAISIGNEDEVRVGQLDLWQEAAAKRR